MRRGVGRRVAPNAIDERALQTCPSLAVLCHVLPWLFGAGLNCTVDRVVPSPRADGPRGVGGGPGSLVQVRRRRPSTTHGRARSSSEAPASDPGEAHRSREDEGASLQIGVLPLADPRSPQGCPTNPPELLRSCSSSAPLCGTTHFVALGALQPSRCTVQSSGRARPQNPQGP